MSHRSQKRGCSHATIAIMNAASCISIIGSRVKVIPV